MNNKFEDLVEDFTFLDDWEDRYRHVIELGKSLPELDKKFRVSGFKVDGCASQVWLVPKIDGEGGNAIFTYQGASDAVIVQGLIGILLTLVNGLSAKEIISLDIHAGFARLGLDQHLSAQRSNGLRAMVERIKTLARAAVNT